MGESPDQHHPTNIMKFVALALTLLLAVGSHAASLQADAPTPLDQMRSGAIASLRQLLDATKKSLDHVDDPGFTEQRDQIKQHIDSTMEKILALQQTVAPYTDSLYAQVESCITDLRTRMEPHTAKLGEVLKKHMEDYRTKFNEITSEHRAEVEELKNKMAPKTQELSTLIETNLEETKSALLPILNILSEKINEGMTSAKEAIEPYIQEYKDQFSTVIESMKQDGGSDLQARFQPVLEEIKAKAAAFGQTFQS